MTPVAIHSDPNETALLRRYEHEQDKQSLDELVYAYEGELYEYIVRFTDSRQEGERVFMETWLYVSQNLDHFKVDEGTVRTWVYGVATKIAARNLLFDAKDRSPVSRALAKSSDESHQKMGVAQECLNVLPENQRAAILMCHRRHFSVEEVAAALGSDIEEARACIKEGTKKLQIELDRRYSEEDGPL